MKAMYSHTLLMFLETALAQWQSVGFRSERSGVQNLPSTCCVLKQDTLLPESTGNTEEAVAPIQHDWKIVDWNAKPQHKQTK